MLYAYVLRLHQEKFHPYPPHVSNQKHLNLKEKNSESLCHISRNHTETQMLLGQNIGGKRFETHYSNVLKILYKHK